jgi:hypothetical protein
MADFILAQTAVVERLMELYDDDDWERLFIDVEVEDFADGFSVEALSFAGQMMFCLWTISC